MGLFLSKTEREAAVQLSVFAEGKKPIDGHNLVKAYREWAALFAPSFSEEEKSRLSEYFLSDYESGHMRRDGWVEWSENGASALRKLPVYEYRYFWGEYAHAASKEEAAAVRNQADTLHEKAPRQFEGEFYTPVRFAEKAYRYLEKTLGKKTLEKGNYRIWDMAAGSGNLESVLPSEILKYTYLSTLNEDDAAYCARTFPEATVFQYDYLNDDAAFLWKREGAGTQLSFLPQEDAAGAGTSLLKKMPASLQRDLSDPSLKWLIFINPPFATSNLSSLALGKVSKTGVSDTAVRAAMIERGFGETGRELFSQFLFRIHEEFKGKSGYLGLFSTLKYLNAPNDKKLRQYFFRYRMERGFLFSSENFEGGSGKFPVAFAVWNLSVPASIEKQKLVFDVFDGDALRIGVKRVRTDEGKPLSEWVYRPKTKYVFPPFSSAGKLASGQKDVRDRVAEGFLCSLMCAGNDFQHREQTAIFSGPQTSAGAYSVTKENFEKSMAVHAARKLPRSSWSNNRDRFYAPKRPPDGEFYSDCAVWSAFADSNQTVSMEKVPYKGKEYRIKNHLFPFSKADAAAWGVPAPEEEESYLYTYLLNRSLSAAATAVLEAARAWYRHLYESGVVTAFDEGYYHLKRASDRTERGAALFKGLKKAHTALGEKILSKLYEYGFVDKDVEYFSALY